jgi:hypothetical protein
MKKIILIITIILPLAVMGQKSAVDKLFERYANKEGFTTVNISGKLLGLASQADTANKATNDMLSKLTGIRILTVEDKEIAGKLDFFDELNKEGFFNSNEYEVLMEVTEKNEVVRFLAKNNGKGKFSDLILVVGGDNNTLISISGVIDPENIGKISKEMNINF